MKQYKFLNWGVLDFNFNVEDFFGVYFIVLENKGITKSEDVNNEYLGVLSYRFLG